MSAIVFWLLLQFSRALRVMRLAAQAPVGQPVAIARGRSAAGLGLEPALGIARHRQMQIGRRANRDRVHVPRSFASARFSPRPINRFTAVRKFTYEASLEYFENGAGQVDGEWQGAGVTIAAADVRVEAGSAVMPVMIG